MKNSLQLQHGNVEINVEMWPITSSKLFLSTFQFAAISVHPHAKMKQPDCNERTGLSTRSVTGEKTAGAPGVPETRAQRNLICTCASKIDPVVFIHG